MDREAYQAISRDRLSPARVGPAFQAGRCGQPERLALHVVIVVVLLLVVAPFRIWQAQDLRSAMQHVRIADLEFQLAELNNHQEPDEDTVLQLDEAVSRG